MANTHGDQGTGKHPHKDSKEPWPHTEDSERSSGEDRSFSGGSSGGSQSSSGSRSEEQSLKEREYKGADGQIHHHTRTYEQQHDDKR